MGQNPLIQTQLAAAVLVAFNVTAIADSPNKISLESMLPAGDVTIEFLDVTMSERGNQLAAKFQSGTDSEWLQKYIARVSNPGEPLPYHQNFGLTEAEYEEFLKASSQMKIAPIGIEWKCRFESQNGIVTIIPLENRSATLRSIKIHLESTHAMASGVKIGRAQYSDDGPSIGYRWKLEPKMTASELASGADFVMATLELFLMNDSDVVRVSHSIKRRAGGQVTAAREIMFQYRVPGVRASER